MKSTIEEKRAETQNCIFLEIEGEDLDKLGSYLNKVGFNLTKIKFLDWDFHGIDLELPGVKDKQWGLITIRSGDYITVSIGFPLNKSSDKFHKYFKDLFN